MSIKIYTEKFLVKEISSLEQNVETNNNTKNEICYATYSDFKYYST